MGKIGNIFGSLIKTSQPNIHIKTSGIAIILYGTILIGLGIWLFMMNQSIMEIQVKYDQLPLEDKLNLTFSLEQRMKKPVYVFLTFRNFYQNHRAMVKALDRKQLEDVDGDPKKLEHNCQGALLNWEMAGRATESFDKTKLDPIGVADPCGLLAKNYPEDVYKDIHSLDGSFSKKITIDNITSKNDMKFKIAKDGNTFQWLKVTDPRFENWMKTSSTKDFMKLWGIIDADLEKGGYNITLANKYDTSLFGGEKFVTLSTSDLIGGKNYSTYRMFILLGVACIITGVILIVLSCRSNKVKEYPLSSENEQETDISDSLL